MVVQISVEKENELRAEVMHQLEAQTPLLPDDVAALMFRFVTSTAMKIARVCYAKGVRDSKAQG